MTPVIGSDCFLALWSRFSHWRWVIDAGFGQTGCCCGVSKFHMIHILDIESKVEKLSARGDHFYKFFLILTFDTLDWAKSLLAPCKSLLFRKMSSLMMILPTTRANILRLRKLSATGNHISMLYWPLLWNNFDTLWLLSKVFEGTSCKQINFF